MPPQQSTLPSTARLLILAVLLPAAVAATNYALLFGNYGPGVTRNYLYPWMALSTAIVSWCVGRYLWPAWLRWLVFVWVLVLLDLLTITACLGGPVNRSFSYVLVTAQIGFLTLWAILGPHKWQWRLPVAVVAAAIVTSYSGSFDDGWTSRGWNVMLFLMSVEIVIVCAGLRWLGFVLNRPAEDPSAAAAHRSEGVYQFGTRHMLIWATAMAPLLLVVRGLDIVVLDRIDSRGLLLSVLLIAAMSTVCLIAIWAVLGAGNIGARMAVLLLMPTAMGAAMRFGSDSLDRTNRWGASRFVSGFIDIGDDWIIWMGLSAALLAALLVFLRADGYRLLRMRRTDSS